MSLHAGTLGGDGAGPATAAVDAGAVMVPQSSLTARSFKEAKHRLVPLACFPCLFVLFGVSAPLMHARLVSVQLVADLL